AVRQIVVGDAHAPDGSEVPAVDLILQLKEDAPKGTPSLRSAAARDLGELGCGPPALPLLDHPRGLLPLTRSLQDPLEGRVEIEPARRLLALERGDELVNGH